MKHMKINLFGKQRQKNLDCNINWDGKSQVTAFHTLVAGGAQQLGRIGHLIQKL